MLFNQTENKHRSNLRGESLQKSKNIPCVLNTINPFIFEQIPGCIGWKNTDLKYAGANKNLLSIMKVTKVEQVLGLNDYDLDFNPYSLNQLFEEQDLMALNGHASEIIHDRGQAKGDKNCLLQKNPLYYENEIIGVIYYCTQLAHSELITSLIKIDRPLKDTADPINYYYVGAENPNPRKLSPRELECLFFQLRGKTAKQIAIILGLSSRTVEDYLDNIKCKLSCQTKAEVLVTAVMHK